MNTIWWHHYSALHPPSVATYWFAVLTGKQDLRQGACHHMVYKYYGSGKLKYDH